MLHSTELSWIQALQHFLRGAVLDPFFIYWDFVDSFWFLILFIAFVLSFINRKEGVCLLAIFVLSSLTNLALKTYFHMPRPCQILPSVGLLCYPSFGFPSGAAQTATVIAAIAFVRCHRTWHKIAAGIFAFFLCFSRIYLGLHFFSDILGGILVGSLLAWIYFNVLPLFHHQFERLFFSLSMLLFIFGSPQFFMQASVLLGVTLGLIWDDTKWAELKKKSSPLFSFLMTILGTTALIFITRLFPQVQIPIGILMGLWFVWLGSFIADWLYSGLSCR